MTDIEALLRFQRYYLALCDKKRFIIYRKSRQIGISWIEALWTVRKRLTTLCNHAYVSRVERTSLQFISYVKFWCKVLNVTVAEEVISLSKEATLTKITFPNGSVVMAFPSGIDVCRGIPLDVTLDEAGFQSDAGEFYNATVPTTTWGYSFHVISSAGEPDCWFEEEFNRAKVGNSKFTPVQTTIDQAIEDGLANRVPGDHKRFLPGKERNEAFLNELMKGMTKGAFAQEYRCNSRVKQGLSYPSFRDEKHPNWPVIPTLKTLPSPAVKCFGSLDWGWTDELVVLIFIECEDGMIYCVDEIYESQLPVDQLGSRLHKLIEKWTIRAEKYRDLLQAGFMDFIYCDVNRPEAVNLVRRYGIPLKNRKVVNIEAGIALSDQVLSSGRVKVFDCCVNLIRELSVYEYPRKGQDDHACVVAGTRVSTSSGDRPIEQIKVGDSVLTRDGYKIVLNSGMTSSKALTFKVMLVDKVELVGTANHPILTIDGWRNLGDLKPGDLVQCMKQLNIKDLDIEGIQTRKIGQIEFTSSEQLIKVRNTSTGKFGLIILGKFLLGCMLIIKMIILSIIQQTAVIISFFLRPSMWLNTNRQRSYKQGERELKRSNLLLHYGINQKKEEHIIGNMLRFMVWEIKRQLIKYVNNVKNHIQPLLNQGNSALINVKPNTEEIQGWTMKLESVKDVISNSSVISTVDRNITLLPVLIVTALGEEPVYNLEIEEAHEYVANGIITHNCDAWRYGISSYMYGKEITVINVPVISKEEQQLTTEETIIRLGHINDPKELIIREILQQELKQRAWEVQLSNWEPGD